ncbi:MAG: D-Ala-D-Ala carboxypeptidase family metallohydrolase [Burkholderiaceae bacterium]
MDTPTLDRVPLAQDARPATWQNFDPEISEYFRWHEATDSLTADRLGIKNTPPDEVSETIYLTAQRMDRVRRLLGGPVIVTSWYRSLTVNRAVGSADTSQHIQGCAVDFRCPSYGTPRQVFEYLRALRIDLGIDQLILERPDRPRPWVHVSFTETPRHQALVIDDNGTRFA